MHVERKNRNTNKNAHRIYTRALHVPVIWGLVAHNMYVVREECHRLVEHAEADELPVARTPE